MDNNIEVTKKLSLASAKLVVKFPYLATMILSVRHKVSSEVSVAGVTKNHVCYWNPDWVTSNDIDLVMGVMYHEVNHLLRGHWQRMRHLDAYRANVCADLEINGVIRQEVKLPAEGLFPSNYNLPDGLSAEEYNKILPENAKNDSQMSQGEGSGATGTPEPWEGDGDSDGVSESQSEAIRKATAEAIADAVKSGRGNVPGHLQRLAEAILTPPKIRWQTVLRSYLTNTLGRKGAGDYSFSRMSKRSHVIGAYLPGMVRPDLQVGVVIDTSGSISDTLLAQFFAEVMSIVKSYDLHDVTVAFTDTEVVIKKARSVSDLIKGAVGGGGTNMMTGIYALNKIRPKPAVIVVLTDGDSYWDTAYYGVPTIICSTGYFEILPDWAKIVKIDEME